MPPCHGGDRRFESGRARQEKTVTLCGGFFFWQTSDSDTNRRSANKVSQIAGFGHQRLSQELVPRKPADVRYPVGPAKKRPSRCVAVFSFGRLPTRIQTADLRFGERGTESKKNCIFNLSRTAGRMKIFRFFKHSVGHRNY